MRTAGLDRYDTRLMAILGLTFGFVFFDRNALSYLMPMIAGELRLDNAEIGLLGSALSLTWAISGWAVGALSDATGRRKGLLLAAVLIFSACSFLSGLAGSFLVLLGARLLMGLAEGPTLPISQSLVALESAPERRGHNMGVMQNFGSNLIGSFLAPLLLVWIAQRFGWRAAFYVAGLPGLVCALLIWRWVREPARAAGPAPRRAGEPSWSEGMLALLRYRNVVLCLAIAVCMVAWMVLAWVFLPLYYVTVRHVSESAMSGLMSVLGLSTACFSLVVPRLSDRIGRRPVMILFCLMGAVFPLAGLFYQGSLPGLGALLFLTWSASGTFPIFMATIPSETIPARYIATSLGIVMGLGELVGGFAAPSLAGWTADRWGLRAPLWIEAGCALAAGLLSLGLRETAPARLRATPAAAAAEPVE